MDSVDFVGAVARGCRDFRGADLRGLELRATPPVDRKNKLDLQGFDFSGANLERAVLQFYSAFISYSHADKSFAVHLHDSLQARGVRCWLDEHDMRVGDRILDVVDEAIRISDKVLLCCSMTSLESWWVKDEMRKALERERREQRSLIIPIMLDHYLLDGWRDGMGAEIRSRLAADMTGWDSNHAIFERGLERIVMALRASA